MKKFFNPIFLLLLLYPFCAFAKSDITDFRIADRDGFTRFVMDMSDLPEYKTEIVGKPERLVIDIKNGGWKGSKSSSTNYKSAVIKSVRTGKHKPGSFRVVLDLATKIKVKDSFSILPDEPDKPYRLVIDIKPVDKKFYATHKHEVVKLPILGEIAAAETPASMRAAKPEIQDKEQGAKNLKLEKNIATKFKKTPVPVAMPKTKIIVIDPGHGGVDPGAISKNGIKEKEITLEYAKELKREFEDYGYYKVILTRDDDNFLSLKSRVNKAKDEKADLFISLHADSNPETTVRGLSVYTVSEKASDLEAERVAASENKEAALPTVDLRNTEKEAADVIIDMVKTGTMNNSALFAETVVKELGSEAKLLQNAHRFAGFVVLTGIDVPSALVELGYLSNEYEERMLKDPLYRNKLVTAIAEATDKYFDKR